MALVLVYDDVQDSFPPSRTPAGTVTAYNNRIVGDEDTLFLTEVNVGDYIYIRALHSFRKVRSIQSNSELIVDRAFPDAVSESEYLVTPKDGYTEVSAICTGATACELDGVSFNQNDGNTWTSIDLKDKLYPIDITALNTTVRVTFKH